LRDETPTQAPDELFGPAALIPTSGATVTSALSRPTTRPQSLVATRAIVVGAAVVVAALAWVVIVPLLGTDVTVPDGPSSAERTDLGIGPVIFAAALASLAGWALLTVLERFTSRGRVIWTAVALVVLVATTPWDADFTTSERLALGVMHLAVAVPLILGFWRTAADPTDTDPTDTGAAS
jgi:hypothetical protein